MNLVLAVIGLLEWVVATAIMFVTVIVIAALRSTSPSTLGNILCITSILLVIMSLLLSAILWIAAFSHAEVQIGNNYWCDDQITVF